MQIEWHNQVIGPSSDRNIKKSISYLNLLKVRKKLNVFFYSTGDQELIVPEWIICQTSALSNKNFAVPYYFSGFPPRSIYKFNSLDDKEEEEDYDLSFCGAVHINRIPIIEYIQREFKEKKLLTVARKGYYYLIDSDERSILSSDGLYHKSLYKSRLCLAPLGCGPQSQRLFEIMSIGNIPVFIGDKRTKFPLDWLIDWKSLIPMIYLEDLETKKARNIISSWLEKSDKELDECRIKIKEVYDKYLSRDKMDILKSEIEKKIKTHYS